jgi:hypothetical protein
MTQVLLTILINLLTMLRGSFLLSRLANFYPSLFTKLAFLDVGYQAPGHGLTRATLENINNAVKGALGYGVFGYFLFFDEEGAAKLMDDHVCFAYSLSANLLRLFLTQYVYSGSQLNLCSFL